VFDLEKLIVIDVETDALHGYTTVHYVVTSTLDGKENTYVNPSHDPVEKKRLADDLKEASPAGHNFLSFDLRALRDLCDIELDPDSVLDTLVVSRLLNYSIKGGHSIEAWGQRLGIKKEGADITDWSVATPLMLTRCISDVRINVALVKRFMRFLQDPDWQSALDTEHKVIWRICNTMTKNGLPFHKEDAMKLHGLLKERLDPIEAALQTDFPPRPKFIRTVAPRVTKKGFLNAQDFRWAYAHRFEITTIGDRRSVVLTGPSDPGVDKPSLDLSAFDGSEFDLYELQPFNPGSPQQVVTRLNEAGWKPTEKTDGHKDALKDRKTPADKLAYFKEFGWKVCEDNLKTLPDSAPESTKKLAQRLVLSSRISDLEEWLALTGSDGKIHGNYNGIGAWTHRLSHNKPNTANIPVAKRSPKDNEFETFVNDINDAMRALFIVDEGCRLLGTDADGIQMRIFAHLVQDARLIDALVNGSKDNGTDIHTLHKNALGSVCKSRDAAKTFIYAWLLGAGIGQVATILECSHKEAKTAVNNFLEFYPGLKLIKEKVIPADAARGYFIGLDGRKVACDSEHLMLAGYLQNGEKVIMARAGLQWMDELEQRNLPYWLLNWVHDEWQTMIPDDDDLAKTVTDIQIQALRDQAEQLGMLCPLEGTTSIHNGFIGGYSWQETH
jgi:DNA polymerase-1